MLLAHNVLLLQWPTLKKVQKFWTLFDVRLSEMTLKIDAMTCCKAPKRFKFLDGFAHVLKLVFSNIIMF